MFCVVQYSWSLDLSLFPSNAQSTSDSQLYLFDVAFAFTLYHLMLHGVFFCASDFLKFFRVDVSYECSGNLSWEQLLRNAKLRKTYVSLYASLLKSDMSRLVVDDNEEIKSLDRELDMEVILQWR